MQYFDPLFAAMNRHKTIVFVHPTSPILNYTDILNLPTCMVEFVADTTRAVANLLLSGTLEKYPDITFIISHADGFIPYIAGRIEGQAERLNLQENIPKGVMHYLKNLYYDTALSTEVVPLKSLNAFVDTSHILFGSDSVVVPKDAVRFQQSQLEASTVFTQQEKNQIARENAIALIGE